MSIWHEEIGDWVLTYNRKRSGSKDVLSATNPEKEIYLSTGESEGMQDPLETLYRSLDYPSESEMPERGSFEDRTLTQHGLETLERNIRDDAAKEILADGRGFSNHNSGDTETANRRTAAYDHEWNPLE